jgi:hypothetical protein
MKLEVVVVIGTSKEQAKGVCTLYGGTVARSYQFNAATVGGPI